jgi:hypothetical protein
MKQYIYIALMLLFCSVSAKAVVVQRVLLKNGTVLNGYIQQQDNNDNITFRSDNAIVNISGTNSTITERTYKVNELDKAWIDWAEKNDAFEGSGDQRTLTLNEIVLKPNYNADAATADKDDNFAKQFAILHPTVSKVKVLERGVSLRYQEFTPNTYTFKWSDVKRIYADKRPKSLLSGIDRVYQLDNGSEVRGQYAGETENTLSLYTQGGMVETFDIDKVQKYLFKPVNPNQSIFEQSELMDVIQTKSNITYRGVIVERNFTEGNNYLVIMLQSGASQMIKFEDVTQYSKEENADYKPKSDVVLKEGEVLVNRVATDSVNVFKKGSLLVLDSINHKVIIPKQGETTKISVEFYNPQHVSGDHLILVKLGKIELGKKTYHGFSADLFEMKRFSVQSTETSVNNTTKLEYTITGSGAFALYDQTTRKAMPFIVK